MSPSPLSTTKEKSPILRRIFPFIGGFGICFVLTYTLVLAGIIGLFAAAVLTSQTLYIWLALCLMWAAVLGQVAPLYPIGILAVFNAGALIIMTCHYGMIQHGTTHSPTTAVVHKVS